MSPRGFVRRGPALRQGQRRKTVWIFQNWLSDTIATDGVVLISILNAAALAFRPFTVVRTRGYIQIATDQAGTTEAQAVSYGQIVVTEDAAAIGITAIPTPETEGGSDFHVYEQLATRFLLNSAVGFEHPSGLGKEFDSKAMRKVDIGDTVVAVVEVGASGQSEGLILQTSFRMLIKLH